MRKIARIALPVLALIAAVAITQGQLAGLLTGGQVRLQAPATSLIAPPEDPHAGHLGAGAAPAPAAIPGPNAARIQLSMAPTATASQGYTLTAQVATPAGAPAGSASVSFYELVDLIGPREMFIGGAVTDGHGSASLIYLPATTGSHEIVARATGIAKVSPGETRATLQAAVAAPPYRPDVPALSRFSDRVPYGVGVVVLGVWLLIAFALIGTARGVLQDAGSDNEKGVIA